MFKMKHTWYFLCILAVVKTHPDSDATQNWRLMQQNYRNLCSQLKKDNFLSLEKQFCHDFWLESKNRLQALILGPVNQNFVANPVISSTMVKEWNKAREYEVCYLKHCLSNYSKAFLANFTDTRFTGLPRLCSDFDCSANTLGHLVYVFKIIEQSRTKKIDTLVEFGAGYGNLARLFKTILPDITIVLIDLPELLALQYFFLTSAFENAEVVMHAQMPSEFKNGAIHLVPVYFLQQLKVETDVFISTFALTEAPAVVQQLVINNKFYNAEICYIDGQLEGTTIEWVKPHLLQDAIQKQYKTVFCHPSHIFILDVPSYEIIGLQTR